jgi:Ni/Fe-hydrogenase 1 B-type cytochrome subunit
LLYKLFVWVPPLVGGLQRVRLIHHTLTWLFIVFALVHIYFTIRSDYLERMGRVSSMITGGRYVSTKEKYDDLDLTDVPATEWPGGEKKTE